MELWQILLIILAVLVVILVVLFFVGKNLQKKVDSQQGLIEQSKQTVSIYVIDKKKLKMKDSKLPQMVQDQVPVYLRWRKMPMVKAKIGPRVETLMCDDNVFKDLPVKKTVKIELAGIYIVGVKSAPKKSGKNAGSAEPVKVGLVDKAKAFVAQYKK